ncbi:hypothetical protein LCGC14_1870170 [marine sediment metagenome]|uniref:Rhamnogalacturonan lyase domain-containing protein n=2 Tax=root TaxID=1 RepID=A0A0F9GTC8_9ZZZZ
MEFLNKIRRKTKGGLAVLIAGTVLGLGSMTYAKEIHTQDDVETHTELGKITGTIRYLGDVETWNDNPCSKKKQTERGQGLHHDHNACKRYRSLVVSEKKGLKWVVISIEGLTQKTTNPDEVFFDQVNEEFVPHVLAIEEKGYIVIQNSDNKVHNVYVRQDGKTLFNIEELLRNQKVKKRFDKEGIASITCKDFHLHMQSYIVVTPNKFFDVTDKSGYFEIGDLPSGNYNLKIWHERLGEKIIPITVKAGETTKIIDVNFEHDATQNQGHHEMTLPDKHNEGPNGHKKPSKGQDLHELTPPEKSSQAKSENTGNIEGKVKVERSRSSADVVVYLERVVENYFDQPKDHVMMDQKNIMFMPGVVPILKGTTVDFINSDNVKHNVFSQDEGFNLGTYGQGVVKTHTFNKLGTAELLCNVHDEMVAYIVVLPNPYFTKTDRQGNFKIENVPPGKYTLKTWHGRKKSVSQEVTVKVDDTTDINLVLKR